MGGKLSEQERSVTSKSAHTPTYSDVMSLNVADATVWLIDHFKLLSVTFNGHLTYN